MLSLTRTNTQNPDYIRLIKFLDADLAEKDGDEHAFYAQFNKSDTIRHVLVAYIDEVAVGCGAIKEYQPEVAEVKRMFVSPEVRGKGIATQILTELEVWAKELGFKKCILETGKKQVEAIALYQKSNYKLIPNYGQYEGMDNSLCFEKEIG
jgi:putative acetyltransferase